MTTAHTDRSRAPDLARPQRRALRRYLARVEALRQAESDYRDVTLLEELRRERTSKPGSGKRVSAALDALVDAVVDLQSAHLDVLALAADEDALLDDGGTLAEALRAAHREYAGYLTARTFDEVREAARPNTAHAAGASASRDAASA